MVLKINKFIACAAVCSFALSANAKEINTNMAQMQAMDKITGKVSLIEVPVGGLVEFGSFSILVRDCKTRSPEETPENFAFVDVVDNALDDSQVNIFKGWMISSSPALNAVEHPIYDIWLLKCVNTDVDTTKLLNAEELVLRDTLPKYEGSKKKEKKPEPVNEQIEETVIGSGLNPAVVEGEVVLDNDLPAEAVEIDETRIVIDEVNEETGAPNSLITIQEEQTPGLPVEEAVEDASANVVDDTPIETISIDAVEEARIKAEQEAEENASGSIE